MKLGKGKHSFIKDNVSGDVGMTRRGWDTYTICADYYNQESHNEETTKIVAYENCRVVD
jgi:hypothetical protein